MSRSVRLHAFGEASVLNIEEVAIPEPGRGEIRLRVRAIGINRTEITLRAGRSPVRPALPTGLGFEAAGTVEALGEGVSGIALGDRVALIPAYSAAQYALYGEQVIAPARSVVAIPQGTPFIEAAATWAAFGTAWGGLVATGGLSLGQTVLIPAASSSVGLAAIQVANRIGARPIAVTRTSAKREALLAQGAAAVIATTEEDLADAVATLTAGKGAELVFDPVGGPTFALLTKATAVGGTVILYGALSQDTTPLSPVDLFVRNLTVRGFALTAMTRNDARVAELRRFITHGLAAGLLRPTVARTFDFDHVADAHRFMEAGNHVGKIVVTV
jgi:NADPH:quinone reductase-like Zn-dependent oxidoreductase